MTLDTRPRVGTLGALLDDGSLVRIRSQVRASRDGPPGDGVICGEGSIDGRRVFCFEQDASVLGGSLGRVHADSICRTIDLAQRAGAPLIGVHRSGGARIQEGVAALDGYGSIFARHVRSRRSIPQIALVLGPCAGGAAYGPALMDFVVMPRTGAFMFLTGPDVVREVTGEDVDIAQLGGAHVASRSGLASLVGADDAECLDLTRRLVSYLPSRIEEPPCAIEWSAPRGDPGAVIPSDPAATYDAREVVGRLVDDGSFLEVRAGDARSLVCGLARLEGRTVGVVANQPSFLAGAIDVSASRKGAWFVGLCDRFRFPLIVLVDTPGFLPGTDQELGGVIPAGASFLSAFVEASVPRATVVLRKAFGGAYIVMNSGALGADAVYAWPTAEIAVLGAKGAVKITGRKELATASDPQARQLELEEEYKERFLSPWPAADAGSVDEVIEPHETRGRLIRALTREV